MHTHPCAHTTLMCAEARSHTRHARVNPERTAAGGSTSVSGDVRCSGHGLRPERYGDADQSGRRGRGEKHLGGEARLRCALPLLVDGHPDLSFSQDIHDAATMADSLILQRHRATSGNAGSGHAHMLFNMRKSPEN